MSQADSRWNAETPQKAHRKLPLAAKIALGCGIAFVCFVVVPTAANLIFFGGKVPSALQGRIQQGLASDWALLRSTVERLRTNEGCQELFRNHPDLAREHGSEDAFIAAMTALRPHLPAPLQEQVDVQSGRFRVQRVVNTTLTLDLADGSNLEVTVKDGRILGLKARKLPVLRFGGSKP